jgi:DNA transposition AAA+ family ATPase
MTTTPERRPGRSGPTIAVIAREAGVSAPTVSKVINGRSDVAPATRRRVEAVIRTHGYRRPVGWPGDTSSRSC